MADTTVTSASTSLAGAPIWGPFWTSPLIGAIVSTDDGFDVTAYKTTDGGANWTKSADAIAGSVVHVAAWFDQQEPGNSGSLIHCVWLDDPGGGSSETFKYANYDIPTNTWSTPVNVATGLTNVTAGSCFIVGTKAGGLVCGFANATASGAFSSPDGVTWTGIANPFESNVADYVLGVWCDTDDDADAAILFWDVSADEVSVKIFDSSGAAWTETSVSGSMVDNSTYRYSGWGVQTRLSDGKSILAAWNGIDLTTADLRCWELDLNSVVSPTITGLTEINTNLAESGGAGVFIDPVMDDIYVVYVKGGTWSTSTTVVYKKSTDGGATWGTETVYSEAAASDNVQISAGHCSATGGGFFQPCWRNETLDDMFVNLVNDVAIAGAVSVSVSGAIATTTAAALAATIATVRSAAIGGELAQAAADVPVGSVVVGGVLIDPPLVTAQAEAVAAAVETVRQPSISGELAAAQAEALAAAVAAGITTSIAGAPAIAAAAALAASIAINNPQISGAVAEAIAEALAATIDTVRQPSVSGEAATAQAAVRPADVVAIVPEAPIGSGGGTSVGGGSGSAGSGGSPAGNNFGVCAIDFAIDLYVLDAQPYAIDREGPQHEFRTSPRGYALPSLREGREWRFQWGEVLVTIATVNELRQRLGTGLRHRFTWTEPDGTPMDISASVTALEFSWTQVSPGFYKSIVLHVLEHER